MLLNPYVAGNPLKDAAQFFGREDILREVMQMLRHPEEKAIVLFGQRRIGKTTILLQLVQRLTGAGEYTPVFFDLQDRASATLKEVLYKLAQTICASVEMPVPAIELFDEEGDYFQREFLAQATGCAAPGGLVILFDEFDVMDSPQKGQAAQAFFPYLRACLAVVEKTKFIFVIGRRPEELSTDTLSTFKGIRAAKVSLLDRKSTEEVIRQSEAKGSLIWSDAAVEKVWSWTMGHTYCTQLVCSMVWERAQEGQGGGARPQVEAADVDAAIPEALKSGANAFHWIWDGLPPAERVVMAAMAEVKAAVISQEAIEDALNRSGVRLVVRELKLAPATLVEWELLKPANGGYRFAVPLLREWVRTNRPLTRTKEELDRLDPLAENLYRAGQSFYSLGKTSEAGAQLRQALTVNPNHLKSRLLLGRILLEQGEPASIQESVQVLEEAYRYDSGAAAADLVKTLLASAALQGDEGAQLDLYQRILTIQPGQPAALERRAAIVKARADQWRALGEQALQQGDFERAIQAFEKAGDKERIEQVRLAEHLRIVEQGEQALSSGSLDKAEEIFRAAGEEERAQKVVELREQRWIDGQLAQARAAADAEDWETMERLCKAVLERRPEQEEAARLLTVHQAETLLADHYQAGVRLLREGKPAEAQAEFVQVVQTRPDYKRAARFLEETVRGVYPAGNGALRGRMLTLLKWVGLAAVIQFLALLLLLDLVQASLRISLDLPVLLGVYLLLTGLPAALAALVARWIESENLLGMVFPGLNEREFSQADAPGGAKPAARGNPAWQPALVFAAVLLVVFLAAKDSLFGILDAAGHSVGDFSGGGIGEFLIFSLLPTGVAWLGLGILRDGWLKGWQKPVTTPPRAVQPAPTAGIPPASTPANEVVNQPAAVFEGVRMETEKIPNQDPPSGNPTTIAAKPAGRLARWIGLGILVFLVTAGITIGIEYLIYMIGQGLNDTTIVFGLWFLTPSAATFFSMWAIVRSERNLDRSTAIPRPPALKFGWIAKWYGLGVLIFIAGLLSIFLIYGVIFNSNLLTTSSSGFYLWFFCAGLIVYFAVSAIARRDLRRALGGK